MAAGVAQPRPAAGADRRTQGGERTRCVRSITPRASRSALFAVAGLALAVGASPLLVSAADHLDAPAAKADHRVDITDIYAFRSDQLDDDAGPERRRPDVPRGLEDRHLPVECALRAQARHATRTAGRHRLPRPLLRSDPQGGRHRTQTYVVRRDVGSDAVANIWSGIGRRRRPDDPVQARRPHRPGRSVAAGLRRRPRRPVLLRPPGLRGVQGAAAGRLDRPRQAARRLHRRATRSPGTNVLSIALKLPNDKLGGTGNSIGVWATTSIRRTAAGRRSTAWAGRRSTPCSTACSCRPPRTTTASRRTRSTSSGRARTARTTTDNVEPRCSTPSATC